MSSARCSEKLSVWILAHSREKKVLHQIDLDAPISATPVAANKTLYVATMKTLHAIALP